MDIGTVTASELGAGFGEARLRSLPDHFAAVRDPREPAKMRHPLPAVLLPVAAASICSGDAHDDIAAWGETRLPFLSCRDSGVDLDPLP